MNDWPPYLVCPEEMESVNTSKKCGKSQGSGENRRRDDDEAAPEEEAEDDDEGNKDDFDWEVVIDEATVEGESGSGEKFYDAEEEAQGSPDLHDEIPAEAPPSSAQQKDKDIAGVDPSGHIAQKSNF
ncbi:hypothetical protein Dimus_037027 [Dionaea muscipula]